MKKLLLLVLIGALVSIHVPVVHGLYQSLRVRQYVTGLEPAVKPSPFRDVRGVFHVHSAQGGHSLGTYPEIVSAAVSSRCRFVFLTEHPKERPLLAEIRDDSRVVMLYGSEREVDGGRILTDERGTFRVGSELHPGVGAGDLDGFEIFNLHESARGLDGWSLRLLAAYHQLVLPSYFPFHLWEINPQRLEQWESLLAQHPVTGLGGADAHQNLGLILQTSAGQQFLRIQVDPYSASFKFVTTHVLLPPEAPVTEAGILTALREGAAYVAFESVAPSDGFSFHAREAGRLLPMGSTISRRGTLVVESPLQAEVRLVHNGKPSRKVQARSCEFENLEPGRYRVELYPLNPPALLASRPWILSNPIYVSAN